MDKKELVSLLRERGIEVRNGKIRLEDVHEAKGLITKWDAPLIHLRGRVNPWDFKVDKSLPRCGNSGGRMQKSGKLTMTTDKNKVTCLKCKSIV